MSKTKERKNQEMERKNQEVEKMNKTKERENQERKNQEEVEEMNIVLKKSEEAIKKWQEIKDEAEKDTKAIQGWQKIWVEAGDEGWMEDYKKWVGIEMQAKEDIDAWERIKYNTENPEVARKAAHNVIVAAYSARAAARNAAKAIETYMAAGAKAREKNEKINEMLYLYTRPKNEILEKSKKVIEKWTAVQAEAEKTIKSIQCWQSMWTEAGDDAWMEDCRKWAVIEMRAIADTQAWKIVNRLTTDEDVAQAAQDVISTATSAARAAREARAEIESYMIAGAIATKKIEKLAELLNL